MKVNFWLWQSVAKTGMLKAAAQKRRRNKDAGGDSVKEAKTSLWTWKFLVLILINLANGAAGQMTFPLVASFALDLGAELTVASSIAGIMSLVGMFMSPVAGYISDRMNRKRLLMVTELLYALFLLGHAFADNIPFLVFLRAGTGVFFTINSVLTTAYASEFIPRDRMGEGLGYFGLVMPLAQALGPALGLGLRDAMGFGAPFIAAGISTIVSFACVVILPYDASATQAAGKKHSLKLNDLFAVEFLSLMLLATLFSSANGLATTYLDILATERGIPNISLFFTAYAVALVFTKPLSGKLQDKKGLYFVMIPAVVFAALGTFLVGIAFSLSMMVLAAVCRAFGQGAGTPCLQAHTVRTLDASKAGVAVSTIIIGQNLGNALAPIGGSFFVTAFGYEAMFCGMGVLTLLVGFLLLFWYYRKEKKPAR